MKWTQVAVLCCLGSLTPLFVACGGSSGSGSNGGGTNPAAFTLTVNSTTPASGVSITVSPADNNSQTSGSTSFTRTYNSGTTVTLTAPTSSGSATFSSWTGCTSASTNVCTITIAANATVTANYAAPKITLSPSPATATLGVPLQFTASSSAATSFTWSVAAPSGSTLSAGTISSSGLYVTPYPAPPTVTITATSASDSTLTASVSVTIAPPAVAAGPALSVDAGSPTHAISPNIYGMDAYLLKNSSADVTAYEQANIAIDRWGGDSTERYNYQLDVTNSVADWYFENSGGTSGDGWQSVSGTTAFDAVVESNASAGIRTVGTLPVQGYVAKDATSCSFPEATYPSQYSFDASRQCGDGEDTTQKDITGNDPTVDSIAEPPPTPPAASAVNTTWAESSWSGKWTEYLVNKYGQGNPASGTGKGVAIYDLDNEPSWWDAVGRDAHPSPFTYDEVTNGGIGTALAVKTIDPTAQIGGPVMDWWWDYFYSKKDVESGWSTGPCYVPWQNPVDRKAHGGTAFIEYYLKQMAAAEKTYGKRLLDYVVLHTYLSGSYNGNSVGLTTAGNTEEQKVRLNSTRAFWDSTYTDSNFQQPNYTTDSNYTSNCNPPAQSPELIPMMKKWVANNYPGTGLSIDEYNWGGMESINGALAQADILGIFGREGLDLGMMWPTDVPSKQIPGMMAFAIYRNYDGAKSTFGDTALSSTSADQGQLSVYGATRTSDGAVTVMVINKTYGDLTATLSLPNFTAAGTASVYLYSNANLNAIAPQTAITVSAPASGSTTSTLSNTFPAQSITLLVIPPK